MKNKNLFSLKNKKIIIFGGNGKLGQNFLKTFLSYNAKKIIVADIKNNKKKIKKVDNYICDVSNENNVNDFFKTIIKKEKKIDTLIYNIYAKPINYYKLDLEYDFETWRKVIDVNLNGAYFVSQKIINHFIKKKIKGKIIFLLSTYGLVSPDLRIYKGLSKKKNIYGGKYALTTPAAYTSSKSGLLGLTKYLATSYGKFGIRVNSLTPGGIFDKQEKKFVKNYSNNVPLNRMANWSEYNGPIVFLASDASSYMNGSNLIVDGGWTAW